MKKDKWALKQAITNKKKMPHESAYTFKCLRCKVEYDRNVIPMAVAECCYCWPIGGDIACWRSWWKGVFGECRLFDDYRTVHKTPSKRALNQLRQVVKRAPKQKGHDVITQARLYKLQQQRRFAVILHELQNAYSAGDKMEEFKQWVIDMRPLVIAELVLQPYHDGPEVQDIQLKLF